MCSSYDNSYILLHGVFIFRKQPSNINTQTEQPY
jgi:hypothetical protein